MNTTFLSGIKGIGAIIVVFYHAGYTFEYSRIGGFGMDILFFLSAFCLTSQMYVLIEKYLNEKRTLSDWGILFSVYFLRRFLRIYPLFFLFITSIYIFAYANLDAILLIRERKFDYFKTLMFAPEYRFHHFWSLPVEMQYYLVIPIVAFVSVMAGKFGMMMNVGFILISIYPSIHVFREHHQSLFPSHFPTFLSGSGYGVIYVLLQRIDFTLPIQFKQNRYLMLSINKLMNALGLILVFIITSNFTGGLMYNWFLGRQFQKHHEYVSGYLGLFVLKEAFFPSFFSDFLNTNLLQFTGKICYAFYMMHPLGIGLWARFQKDPTDRLIFIFLAAYALAVPVYYFVETPIQNFTNKLSIYIRSFEKGKDENLPKNVDDIVKADDDDKIKKVNQKPNSQKYTIEGFFIMVVVLGFLVWYFSRVLARSKQHELASVRFVELFYK